jgi:hypothetical protein
MEKKGILLGIFPSKTWKKHRQEFLQRPASFSSMLLDHGLTESAKMRAAEAEVALFWWFWGEGCPVFGVKTLER